VRDFLSQVALQARNFRQNPIGKGTPVSKEKQEPLVWDLSEHKNAISPEYSMQRKIVRRGNSGKATYLSIIESNSASISFDLLCRRDNSFINQDFLSSITARQGRRCDPFYPGLPQVEYERG
jgi:hypothetical protein